MPSGDGLDRLSTVILGQTLEIEDLPLEDPTDVGPPQILVALGDETGLDVSHGVLDHVLEGLIAGTAFRLLPHDQGEDEQEHSDQEHYEGEDRRTHSPDGTCGPEVAIRSCLGSERLDRETHQ